MIRLVFACGLLAATAAASAQELPLTYRPIPAKEVLGFAGGYGPMAQLRLTKPAALKKETKPLSRHALYADGREMSGGRSLLLRVDESKGDGKGYDQLIVDMNHNGDLTDDTPAPLVVLPAEGRSRSQPMRQKLFGPIMAPAGKIIAGGPPVYFAQGYINSAVSSFGTTRNAQNMYLGYVRFKAGWYAEATAEVKGVKRKVGIIDSDCNLHLGDLPKAQTYKDGDKTNWFFRGGDTFLVDADGSGSFENDAFGGESSSFSPLLYVGSSPCKVALTPDFKALRVEPWGEPLAEVSLKPNGEQVQSVTLAWEQANRAWQLIQPGVEAGKVQVPPGAYRLYSCRLIGKGAPRDQVMVAGYQRLIKPALSFEAGKAGVLRCGAPMEIAVTASKRQPRSYELNDSSNPPSAADSEYILAINGLVKGGDGEVYSTFGKGEQFKDDPPQPRFTVVDADGKKVASGNLEFG